jgi:FtsP/CotA-like multicopper oxidase with cupredoxin domain
MTTSRTNLIWPAITAVTVLFLIVTMVLQYQAAPTSVAMGTTAPAAPASVDIELSEFAITPAPVVVPAGVPVTMQVSNVGTLSHDLHLVGGPGTPEMMGGASETLELDALEAGTYELLCEVPGHAASGMTATLEVTDDPAATTASDEGGGGHAGVGAMTMSPEEMVEHHNDGIAKFLDGWGGTVYGNNLLEPTVDEDGALVFELTADEIEWETKPGVTRTGLAYNGQIPGPMIRAEVGEHIKIVLHNESEVPTAIHAHGLVLPNAMDGVPGITQDAVMPGESFTYDIVLRNAGSHMYHSHFDSAWQVPAGLLGALVVDDPQRPVEEDIDYTMILNDGPLGFTINGKDFPATEPIVAAQGDQVRVRFMNEGLQIHPMHLHGMHMTVIEKDGYPLPSPYMLDTLNIAPGERYDVVIEAAEPGAWAFHCHILNHAEGADGMFGMVTALVITE